MAVGGAPNGSALVYTPGGSGGLGTTPAAVDPFPAFAGEVRTATGDFDGDGVEDTVLVTGPGVPARVAVVNGKDGGVLVPPSDPFGDANFTLGAFVAAGDLDRDGRAEWVVTPELRGGPRVVIFHLLPGGTFGITSAGQPWLVANFFGIGDPAFRDGDRPAPGDVNGDGRADPAVTGDNLLGTGNQVTIFSGTDLRAGRFPGAGAAPLAGFTVAGQPGSELLSVAAVDVGGDGRADVIVGSGAGQPARVKVYSAKAVTGAGTEPPAAQVLDPFGGAVLTDGVFIG